MINKHMRALLQRVSHASVTVNEQLISQIDYRLLILLGIGRDDNASRVKTLTDKIAYLRIFEDDEGKMNRSLLDIHGQALVVSQFTLYANARKGRRPSFAAAAPPDQAEPLVEDFKAALAVHGIHVAGGVFGASMAVSLTNDGPVTIWLDSDEL